MIRAILSNIRAWLAAHNPDRRPSYMKFNTFCSR
jgi:hypothetical protein